MLTFHCSDCNETINSADDESVKQVFDRLDEHIAKCPRGRRLLSRERRTLPGRELTIYDQSLSALRVSYGHTDHWLKQKTSTQPALSNFPRFKLFNRYLALLPLAINLASNQVKFADDELAPTAS